MTARLEVLGDDGEWHEVPGVVSVELHEVELQEQPAPLQLFVETYRPVLDAAVRTVQAYGRALRQAGLLDEGGRPVHQRDRPAWQSPYGPPQRRR